MFSKLRNYLFALGFLTLSACSTSYQVIKTNREEYNINNKVAVDSSIIKTYLPYKVQLDAEMNKVIGYSEVNLTKGSNLPESVLGNFFADAIMHQAKKIIPHIDFALPTTKGGLRNDIVKGPIIISSIFELMPFENQLVMVELSGADALTVIKYIAATNGQPVARLTMNIKDKLPENIKIDGKPFDVNKTYMVLTSDYIANGGDDSQGFTNPISRKNIGLLVRTALLNEVEEVQQSGRKINAKLDGRITKN
jgi:2',3'-cyclic-nucleotide 2'-phosphodiesterase (5'-nucleotidase family)